MKAVVATFNQEKALVGAFSVIVQPVVEPIDRFAALDLTLPRPAAGGAVCEWACLVAARGAARGGAVPGGGAGRGRRARAVLGRAEVAREPDRRLQVGTVKVLELETKVKGAFNQETAIVGAFSVITNLRMELFGALVRTENWTRYCECCGR